MRQTQDFVSFFTKYDIYSNWYPCQFQINGVSYGCVEQAMMHAKAMLFSDHATADRIVASADPKIHKARGREVPPMTTTPGARSAKRWCTRPAGPSSRKTPNC